MSGLQNACRGILPTQINGCTSNVNPSPAFAGYDDEDLGAHTNRHCEPTGRANARPMTGSAKQSMLLSKGRMDCSHGEGVCQELAVTF